MLVWQIYFFIFEIKAMYLNVGGWRMNNGWKVQANLFRSILIKLAGWIQRARSS